MRILLIFTLNLGIIFTFYAQSSLSSDLKIQQLTPNCMLYTAYLDIPRYGHVGANGLIYKNENQVILFDTPWNGNQTEDLVKWITDSLQAEITAVIVNHWHEDCMGGLQYFLDNKIPCYANELTKELATTNNLPIPSHCFNDSITINFNNHPIECYFPGPAHSLDNIVCWIKDEKILFAGCMVKSINSNDLGNTKDGSLDDYSTTIKKVFNRFNNPKLVIPGHGNVGNIELIKHTLQLAEQAQK